MMGFSSRPHFQPERHSFRREIPFSGQERSYLRPQAPSSWQDRKPPRPQRPAFTVVLLRGSGRRGPGPKDLDALFAACPSSPDEFFVYHSGPFAGRLFFQQWCHALEAIVYFWRRRLDGAHSLLPRVDSSLSVPSDKAEEAGRLRALFAAHARGLLECESVRRCEGMIEQVAGEIRKVRVLLSRRGNRLGTFSELQARQKRLGSEKEQLEARLVEFRAAIRCILTLIGESQDDVLENDCAVELFKLGPVFDWSCIHGILVRECRRLDDGLPIYGCRRKILNNILSNQVMVLIGETGSGKSTQLVQFLADSGLAVDGSIVCTQPRKIAAMSLAQRVAEESNGCYKDNFVISYPTYSSSQGFNSNIIYMTDHCLLHHCMDDMALDGISFIIVDEAHERSLNTDLLLALIKKKLLQRFDLRLIIMSATADASKLAEYFDGCCTFYVMGRNFPVEIKYVPDISAEISYAAILKHCSGSSSPYVSDVLKMVSVIHKTEEDGAILAFLTSQMEVEWACENFNDPSAIVLPLHGKLSCEEQSRVFQNYPGKRKVIFSTNVAETSLTIRGVKYVVDSGMVKDGRFEPSTGMTMLKVCRISQSSANQRAGRAGRTEPGKCYRLYSECDFQSMQMHQEPEINKVHLGMAVLRILALGIKNVLNFEFVDAPNSKAIDTAMQNLIQLGAINRKHDVVEMTETGYRLVKLGIEPRLGKIILDSFDCGLRKEGLVLAAVMANASSIFCRVGSIEDKHKADCLKMPFCHRDGDLFTLLSVYKEWEDERESKNKWCWQNSINAKSMRRCQETVLELENSLQHELNIIIPSYWLWNPHEPTAYDQSLKKVILKSLFNNLAMYSGFDRLGYEVVLTGQYLQPHPSCSLLVYGQKPTWVVFGEILSISNQYLVCVTAVDYECLCRIQSPLYDVVQLERRKLQMNVITGVENSILRRICGKLNSNLQSIVSRIQKECMDNRIGIDVEFEKGEVQLFASAKDMEKVSCILNEALECERKWLRDECIEKCLYHGGSGSSASVALFGSGAQIKHLELENRYLTVEISHQNAHALDDKELLMVIDKHVPGIASFYKQTGCRQEGVEVTKWGKITFLSPEDAENAVAKLNELQFHGSLLKVLPVKAVDYKSSPFSAVRVKVCWPRRVSKGVALIKCRREDADFIVADCSELVIGERYINCMVSTKFTDCIFVTGLPKDTSEPELYDAFVSATRRKILDVHVLRGETISNPPSASCAKSLVKEITPFMVNKHFPNSNFRVEVFDPEPKDCMMKAVITFDGSLHLEAAKALDHIEGKVLPSCLPWQKIQCQHMFHSSVYCPARIYFVIKKQVDSLIESFKYHNGVSCRLERTENGSYRVKISASATKTVADLRKPLEQLNKGKTISHPSLSPTVLHLLLSRDGIALMKALERDTGTYIMYDRRNLNVKLFGPQKGVAAAEEKLVKALLSLHESKQLEIHLRHRNLPPDLMMEVVRRFGPDLQGLKEKVPGVELILKTRGHILCVRGSKELKQKVGDIISEVARSLDSKGVVERPSEEASCPICLCELEEPHRLEACSHDFCRTCLIEMCESAIKSRGGFPLCCTKDGCGTPILLSDLRSLLLPDKLEELFRASLDSFVESSGGVYRFCPSPDCSSVYRVAPPDAAVGPFVCGACAVETCTKCHLEYHPLVSCEMYREFKDDPDLSLEEWRKGKQEVKDCPSCGNTIEKIDGCNHISCRCGRHICWVCLESFPCSQECYAHLGTVHNWNI